MSTLHVLESSSRQGNFVKFRITIHANVPAGNNSAGVAWSTAIVNSLAPVTVMKIGDGTGGTITAAEAANIANGTVIEGVYDFSFDVTLGAAARNAALDAYAAARITERSNELQDLLRFYGATR